MFLDIDYKKRLQNAKFRLAKPNQTIISSISENFGGSLSKKMANINELSFSIPYFVEENGQLIENKHIKLIREKMLIQIKMGTYKEWFIVDSIEESDDDSSVFNVNTFSLGYELAGKRVSGLVVEGENATNTLKKILEGTLWEIDFIDPMFDGMFRSFDSGEDSNALESVTTWAETFGGLLIWDTEKRKISLKNLKTDGKFTGLTVTQDRLIKTINRNRTTDELITRLYVEGSEGLTIHSMNPTGQGYLEDFSYFMYPFKRDEKKKVIQSSYYMSDDLCHALLDHQALIKAHTNNIQYLTKEISDKTVALISEESKLNNLELELDNILELLDTAKAVLGKLESVNPKPDTTAEKQLVTQKEKDKKNKEDEIARQKSFNESIEREIDTLTHQLDVLQSSIESQANFTQELLNELNPYIIESVWREDRIADVKELYDEALIKFSELREPKVVIDISMDNLLSIIDEQYYWNKLNIGDLIKVKYALMGIEYMAKIIEMNYDFENNEVSLVIANTKDLLDDNEKLVQLIYNNSSATSIVQNNKYKWNKVNAISKDVSSLLTGEWNANKQKIIAGINNSIEVGKRGIIITNPDLPSEMVIMQAGIIALSKDGGETWQTAIKPDGIVAERLVGKLIAGQELLITNSAGSFVMDNNGMRIQASSFIIESNGNNLIDDWQETTNLYRDFQDDGMLTAYEKKMIKYDMDKRTSEYNAYMERAEDYYSNPDDYLFITNYKHHYRELYDYLFVEIHGDKAILAEDNMEFTTRIIKDTYDNKIKNYDISEAEVRKQFDIYVKNLAQIAKDLADEAQDNIDEVMNDIVYKIELVSSNGFMFRNGVVNTEIQAYVYRGSEDITSQLPKSSFIWSKKDKDGREDTSWNNSHKNVGNKLTVSGSDVFAKATFTCQINIEE